MKTCNKKINPTGDKPVLVFNRLFTSGLLKSFAIVEGGKGKMTDFNETQGSTGTNEKSAGTDSQQTDQPPTYKKESIWTRDLSSITEGFKAGCGLAFIILTVLGVRFNAQEHGYAFGGLGLLFGGRARVTH